MAVLIVMFDGAVPQSLAKDSLLHIISVRRTSDAAIQHRLIFVSYEHMTGRADREPVNSVGGAVPDGVCGIAGCKQTSLARSSRRTRLAVISIRVNHVIITFAFRTSPKRA